MGSSPLTRGKRRPSRFSTTLSGLIPAHAGKTGRAQARGVAKRAHPRSRGENSVSGPPAWTARGSSPLTRGKRPSREPSAPWPWAHPRSRGENEGADKASTTGSGSSPLTRGKRDRRAAQFSDPRLIPAHAGKTMRAVPGIWIDGAHPRSRGENYCPQARRQEAAGSSPLTRGKPCPTAPGQR